MKTQDVFEWTMRDNTVVLLLLFVALVELVPEIGKALPISTTNVRKIWSCSYFGSIGIICFLEAIFGDVIKNNAICHYLFKEMRHLYNFGEYRLGTFNGMRNIWVYNI